MKITELQLDALKEIGNIGAGNAAVALSQLIGMAIVLIVAQNNRYETFKPLIPKVQQALQTIQAGQLVRVESGD